MKKIINSTLLFLLAFAIQIQAQTVTKTFRGFLSGKPIEMTLTRDGEKLSGTYLYTKYKTDIKLSGTIDADGNFKFAEFDPKGAKTGEFAGTWKENENNYGVMLDGVWTKPKSDDSLGFIAAEQIIEFSDGRKFTTRYFTESNKQKRFEMTAEYPELTGASPEITAKFKTAVMSRIGDFRKTMLAQTSQDLKYLPKGMNNYIEVSYDVVLANDNIVSLKFLDSEYAGGAHPNYMSFTMNVDLKTGRELELRDLFKPNSDYLKAISEYAIADLKKRQPDVTDDTFVKDGASADAANFRSWNITKKGLLINFDPYQVAPYAAGSQEVIIPFDKLKDVLRDNAFLPMGM